MTFSIKKIILKRENQTIQLKQLRKEKSIIFNKNKKM